MDLGYVTRRSVGTWMGEKDVTMTRANMGHMRDLSIMRGHCGLCLVHSRTHIDLGYATTCSVGTLMDEEGVHMTRANRGHMRELCYARTLGTVFRS